MIQIPDLQTIVLAYLVLSGIIDISLGATGRKKMRDYYGGFDVAWGVMTLLVVMAIIAF